VVILNYNGAKWLERCLASLQEQTIFNRIEVIVADNLSTDGSDRLAEKLVRDGRTDVSFRMARTSVFAKAITAVPKPAIGEYLFFLNNDTCVGTRLP